MYLSEAGRRRGPRRGKHSVPVLALSETRISLWEERDRAHVELINAKNDATIVEWRDEEVKQAIEDGFLKPGKLHETAYDYAVHVGLIQRPRDAVSHAQHFHRAHPLPPARERVGRNRARKNPVARDFPEPIVALKVAVEKYDAVYVLWDEREKPTRSGTIGIVHAYSPKGNGFIERELDHRKGLWHWPAQGKLVKALPAGVELIKDVIERDENPDWKPDMYGGGAECACDHCGARENPVDVSDGIPWVKTERNAEDFQDVRAIAEKVGPIKGSRDVYELMHPWVARQDKEHLCVILLDIHSMLRGVAIIHIGQRDRVAVDPADVLKPAIERGAKGLCILHNHPSGNADHSPADANLTKAIKKACETNDIAFIDHVVMGSGEYYSFADKKLHKVRSR